MRQILAAIADPFFAWVGLFFFAFLFLALVIYVLFIKDKKELEKDARIPLENDNEEK